MCRAMTAGLESCSSWLLQSISEWKCLVKTHKVLSPDFSVHLVDCQKAGPKIISIHIYKYVCKVINSKYTWVLVSEETKMAKKQIPVFWFPSSFIQRLSVLKAKSLRGNILGQFFCLSEELLVGQETTENCYLVIRKGDSRKPGGPIKVQNHTAWFHKCVLVLLPAIKLKMHFLVAAYHFRDEWKA